MKKMISDRQSIEEDFNFLKIKRDKLKLFIEYLKSIGLKDIKIIDSIYEYEESDLIELKTLDDIDIIAKYKNSLIIIHFESSGNYISIDGYSNELYGVILLIKKYLDKYTRSFFYFFKNFGSKIILIYLIFFIMPIASIPDSIVALYHLEFLRYLIGMGFILVTFLIVYVEIIKYNRNIVINNENYILKHKDKIILLIIGGIIGQIFSSISNFLSK